MLTVSHLTKRYGKTEACRDVSFTLEPGTVTVLLGPNGAGKSTLMKAIIGFLRYEGEIFVGGKPNPDLMRRLDNVRGVLTSGGRTLAQGCLAWLWARSPRCVPVPGFRTEKQAVENAQAMRFGPLTPAQMAEITQILSPGL